MSDKKIDSPQQPCPEGRLSASTKTRDDHEVVDISTYIPHLLSSVNNALSRGASQLYIKRFGIGIVEWRVLSMLAIEPRISASRICAVIALNKGATSRALAQLNTSGYLSDEPRYPNSRKKNWWLSEAGYRLHDQILEVALERECQLIGGVNPRDLEIFIKVMRAIRSNIDDIQTS